LRSWLLALTIFLALGSFAACGGEEEAEERDDLPSVAETAAAARPVVSPSPTAESAEAEPMTCVLPADVQSFRLTMAFEEVGPQTGAGTNHLSVLEILSSLGGDYGGLFDDFTGQMTIEFASIMPDRSSLTVTEHGEEWFSCVMVRPRVWCKSAGSTDWSEDYGSPEDFPSSPEDLCAFIQDDLPLSPLDSQKETVNGIPAVRYRVRDEVSEEEWQGNHVGVAITHDVWLAEDGNWPVKMVFKVDYEGDLVDEYSLQMEWEITDFNDPTIAIEAPSASDTTPGAVEPTCVFPADIRSFRLTITQGDIGPQTAPDTGSQRPSTTPDLSQGLSPSPVGFSPEEGTAEYAYVAPDRWSMVASNQGVEIWSWVAIGDQGWWKEPGSSDWKEGPTSEGLRSYSLQEAFCGSLEGWPISPEFEREREVVNGIKTIHYQAEGYYMPEAPEGREGLTMDIWLAENGNWPVRMILDAEDDSRDSISEISDLNDPSIVIEPPTLR
jgi:hypothetical protein